MGSPAHTVGGSNKSGLDAAKQQDKNAMDRAYRVLIIIKIHNLTPILLSRSLEVH